MTRVLIADDEASIRFVLREALSAAGHDVVEAVDGNEARERLGTQRFDLALLDIRMPGPSGLELLDEVASRGADAPLVVIPHTGVVWKISRTGGKKGHGDDDD